MLTDLTKPSLTQTFVTHFCAFNTHNTKNSYTIQQQL